MQSRFAQSGPFFKSTYGDAESHSQPNRVPTCPVTTFHGPTSMAASFPSRRRASRSGATPCSTARACSPVSAATSTRMARRSTHPSARSLQAVRPVSLAHQGDAAWTLRRARRMCELTRRNAPTGDVYRPFAYDEGEGLGPSLAGRGFAIYMLPVGDLLPQTGLHVMVSSWRRVTDNAIPARGKISGAYVNSALVREDARVSGFDDAIVLNEREGGRGVGGQPHARSRRDADHAGHHGRHSRGSPAGRCCNWRVTWTCPSRSGKWTAPSCIWRTRSFCADGRAIGAGGQRGSSAGGRRTARADRDDTAAPLHGHRARAGAACAGWLTPVAVAAPCAGRRVRSWHRHRRRSRCRPRRPATVRLADSIESSGFVLIDAPVMRHLLGAEISQTEAAAFADSWNGLPLDESWPTVGAARRRHAVLAEAGGLTRQPNQPHYQSLAHNPLNGGIARWFAPIPTDIGDGPDPAIGHQPAGLGVGSAARHARPLARGGPPVPDRGPRGQAGQPTPEGMHRDGVDFVLVI